MAEGKNISPEEMEEEILENEEINDAIKHIDYNKWLNVSFTGNKKWAV